ncbi:MAG: hypothetical protein U9R57_08970 [Thermodesulfobacteriota bacterium]|nr:hypothetical protein [Thermodesulfobacteriota bacterium]
MITYLYWFAIFAFVAAALYGIGLKAESWKAAIIVALVVLLAGWATYFYRLEQIFVKRYGGVMSIHVPEGQHHLAATWKDDNLWIENYDPKTNTCIFSEYSKGNMLQGKVTITNCNPLISRQ